MSCRLLYLVGQLRAGGSERQLYLLLEGLNRKRYQPEVVVWNFREDAPYFRKICALGVPVRSLAGGRSRVAKLVILRRIVKQISPEVLHSYTFYTNLAAWWATRGSGTLAVGAVQSDYSRAKMQAGWGLGRLCARWPRSQIFNSFTAAQTAQRSRSLFLPEQLFVVRNGLDLQRFRHMPLTETGKARIISVGSLLPVKRWDRLLVAASSLKEIGLDFLIQLVGDGPLREPLKRQAQILGVSDRVEFRGYCDDIPRLLSNATLLAHTSDSEGCPNAVMEAMACGRAVVATDVGDVPNLIEDGKTGFVVQRGDEPMLVSRMATLITDRDLCRRLGEAGRSKAAQEFGLDRLVSETLAAYRAAGWKGVNDE